MERMHNAGEPHAVALRIDKVASLDMDRRRDRDCRGRSKRKRRGENGRGKSKGYGRLCAHTSEYISPGEDDFTKIHKNDKSPKRAICRFHPHVRPDHANAPEDGFFFAVSFTTTNTTSAVATAISSIPRSGR